MHTPTHALVNLALLGRRNSAARTCVIAAGAILPDIPAIVFHIYYRLIRRWPEEALQSSAPAWKTATMVLHAFPVALLLLTVAAWRRSTLGVALGATLLAHAALDLPVHHGDALRQFWPISDYRFISPLSYWDSNHYAGFIRIVELALLMGSSLMVWRRHRSRWLRAMLVVTNGVMAAALLSGRLFWSL